jgi:WD40 repeat protein
VHDGTCYFVAPLYYRDDRFAPLTGGFGSAAPHLQKLLEAGATWEDFEYRLAFSADGTTGVIAAGEGETAVFDTDQWNVKTKIPHRIETGRFWLNDDGSQLATNSEGQAILWNTADAAELGKTNASPTYVAFIKTEEKGKHLLLIERDRTVLTWHPDEEEPTRICQLEGPSSPDTAADDGLVEPPEEIYGFAPLQVARDGRRVVLSRSCTFKTPPVVWVWSLPEGKIARQITLPSNNLASGSHRDGDSPPICLSHDGKRLAILDTYAIHKVWNVDKDRDVLVPPLENRSWRGLSRDGRWLLSRGRLANTNRSALRLYDVESGQRIWFSDWGSEHLAVADGGDLVAEGTGNGVWLRRRDPEQPDRFLESQIDAPTDFLRLPSRKLTALSMDAVGTLLATADSEGSIRLWDTRTGEQLLTLTPDMEQILRVVLSCGGNYLAAVDAQGIIRVWDLVETRRRLRDVGLDWP